MIHVQDSRSDEQQEAEGIILASVNSELGLSLSSEKLRLSEKVVVQLDGLDEGNRVVCEIYSRIGKLRGSQPDKVASDLLKMSLLEETRGGSWRKVFAFADSDAARQLTGRSWLAAAASLLKVEVIVVELPQHVRAGIEKAQARQKMVNPRSESKTLPSS